MVLARWIALLPVVLLLGCTSTLVLETSKDVAANAQQLNQNLTSYQRALEQDAAGRVDRIASQRVELASLEFKLNRRLAIWDLTDRVAAERLYGGVQELVETSLDAERDLKNRLAAEKKELKVTQSKYESQQKALASLAKQLNAMAVEPDWKTQLQFLGEFGKETSDEIKKLQAERDKPESGS